jgi:hypothetical protein
MVHRQGLPGAILYRWEPFIPFVKPGYENIGLFLYGSVEDAKRGSKWGGSGFVLAVAASSSDALLHLYAVTNDHVAMNARAIRLTPTEGDAQIVPVAENEWVRHPDGDDVSACYLGMVGAHAPYACFDYSALIRESDLGEVGYVPGDDCFMVGRYINHEGRQFDRGVLRFGNLAMLPETIYQPKRVFLQESFVVDMRSAPGFSGSPVLIFFEQMGTREPYDGFIDMTKKRWSGMVGHERLLGVHWGSLPVWEDAVDASGKKVERRVNSSMAAVVPAWKLNKLIDEGELMTARKDTEDQHDLEHREGPVLEGSDPDQFDRFNMLAREIVKVPKEELDRKRDEAKRDR